MILTDQISYMLFNCHYLLGKNILLDLIFPPKYRFSKKNGLCIQNVYNFNKWKQLAKLFSGAKIEGCSGHPMQYVPGHNRVKLFIKPNSKNQDLWFHEIFFYLMIKCANHFKKMWEVAYWTFDWNLKSQTFWFFDMIKPRRKEYLPSQ